MNEKDRTRIGITMGDPSGIGPEIVARALSNPEIFSFCSPVVFGDASLLERAARLTGCTLPPVEVISTTGTDKDPGLLSPEECGRCSMSYVDAAFRAAMNGGISAVATAPINKSNWRAAGLPFKGHTDYLASRSLSKKSAMLFSPELPARQAQDGTLNVNFCVSLATIHEPIAAVPGILSAERILDTITLTNDFLINSMRIAHPRIAVLGLNPHAGENGMLGAEENQSIIPAIKAAGRRNINAKGPFPADTLFRKAFLGEFDGVVAMYHDQGLIPVKTHGFERMVNITVGLPFIRTSVDHGTADDIAWRGKADATNMVAAILTAAYIASNKNAAFPAL